MKQKYFIDSHKGITAPIIILLIIYFHQWENPTALVYLALHGTYGIMWVLKSKIFPDSNWEMKCSIWYGIYIWMGLSLYWISPWIITSTGVTNSPMYLTICIITFIMGVFFHYTSDMQKYVYMQLRPGSLITTGMMSKCRNINYFGELLIYISFALLSRHWLPISILLLFILIIWFPNMINKDKSLSRYKEFKDYKKRTSLFIPFIW